MNVVNIGDLAPNKKLGTVIPDNEDEEIKDKDDDKGNLEEFLRNHCDGSNPTLV